jgi:hypothetical protein
MFVKCNGENDFLSFKMIWTWDLIAPPMEADIPEGGAQSPPEE